MAYEYEKENKEAALSVGLKNSGDLYSSFKDLKKSASKDKDGNKHYYNKKEELYNKYIKKRVKEKKKMEIKFTGLKKKIYIINILTMIKMNGILSIRNKEEIKMVKCTYEKHKYGILSSQHGQFSAFKGFFYKRG